MVSNRNNERMAKKKWTKIYILKKKNRTKSAWLFLLSVSKNGPELQTKLVPFKSATSRFNLMDLLLSVVCALNSSIRFGGNIRNVRGEILLNKVYIRCTIYAVATRHTANIPFNHTKTEASTATENYLETYTFILYEQPKTDKYTSIHLNKFILWICKLL